MAIYHCSIKIISRGKGKSAVAAAAYRSGEKLVNEYDGAIHDYTRKGGIHGIYTREREEEIIRAKWVVPSFKKQWISFFYMLSDMIYQRAFRVTSLFTNAMKTQIQMGCAPEKATVFFTSYKLPYFFS